MEKKRGNTKQYPSQDIFLITAMNFPVANKKSKWTSIEIFCFHHSFRQARKFTSNPSALYVSVPNCLIRGLERNMGFKQRLLKKVIKYENASCREHCVFVLQDAGRCHSPGWLGPVFQDECVQFLLCHHTHALLLFHLTLRICTIGI